MADKLDHWHSCQSAARSTVIDRFMVPYYLSRNPGLYCSTAWIKPHCSRGFTPLTIFLSLQPDYITAIPRVLTYLKTVAIVLEYLVHKTLNEGET